MCGDGARGGYGVGGSSMQPPEILLECPNQYMVPSKQEPSRWMLLTTHSSPAALLLLCLTEVLNFCGDTAPALFTPVHLGLLLMLHFMSAVIIWTTKFHPCRECTWAVSLEGGGELKNALKAEARGVSVAIEQ